METSVRGYRISGMVQGVGFRFWTQRQALRLGLTGTVRNCADGSVEVYADGPVTKLDEFALLLKRGPGGARVEAVDPLLPPADDLPAGFEIRR